MTARGKGGGGAAAAKTQAECCMCGDEGLSYELFKCKFCQFRSQHSYCSNLYPNAGSYRVCNWCLAKQKDQTTDNKAQNSSNSSSSHKATGNMEDDGAPVKTKRRNGRSDPVQNSAGNVSPKEKKRFLRLQQNSKPLKKQRSPERSPPASATRKRVMSGGGTEEMRLRRTRSSDDHQMTNNSGIATHVFRNYKVRRYKHLDEVSSQ